MIEIPVQWSSLVNATTMIMVLLQYYNYYELSKFLSYY